MNEAVSSLAALLPPLASGLTRSAAILAVALVAVFLLRRRASAAARHRLLATALLALPLVPLLPLASAFIPALLRPAEVPAPSPTLAAKPAAGLPAPAPLSVALARPAAPAGAALVAPAAPSLPPATVAAGIAVAVWLAGALLGLARIAAGLFSLRGLLRRSRPADFGPLAHEGASLGAPPSLRVFEADAAAGLPAPVTAGARRPVLVVPAGALAGWPAERRRAVLLHELAHVARGDWAVHLAAQVVGALNWCDPLTWLALRQLSLLAEQACDDRAVTASGMAAPDYARHLLDVVTEARPGGRRSTATAALGMADGGKGAVQDRVASLLEAKRRREGASRRLAVGSLLGAAVALLLLAALRPADGRQPGQAAAGTTRKAEPGFSHTSRDGVKVELLAVTTAENEGDDTSPWWTPDGKPLDEPPTLRRGGFHRMRTGGPDDPHGRSFAFRLSVPKAMEGVSTTGLIPDPEGKFTDKSMFTGRDLRLDDNKLSSENPAESLVRVRLKAPTATATYRFGIATGEWKTISRTPFTLPAPPDVAPKVGNKAEAALNIGLGDKPTARFSLSTQPGYWTTFRKPLDLLGPNPPLTDDDARRVVLFDAAGKEIPTQPGGMGYDGVASVTVAPSEWRRIAYIDLQTRPYEWLDFENVALAVPPALANQPEPVPVERDAVKGVIRRDIPGGYAVTLLALTRRKSDGGGWWAPDGTPMSGPLKGDERTATFQGWPKDANPRALFLTVTGPKGAKVTVATRLDDTDRYASSFESELHDAGSRFGLFRGFKPGAATTTLRVGLGTGDWQPSAPLTVSPEEVSPRDAKQGDLGGDLELELSAEPKLMYRDRQGKAVKRYLAPGDHKVSPDVAKRIVAVLKDGRTVPLTTAANGAGDLAFVWVNRDSGGAAYRYNKVTLAEVKAFRLETRPYRWVTLPNIALNPR